MDLFRRIPATLSLIIINIIVFVVTYVVIGTFDEPQWTTGLLALGAQFNPLTLDKEWYRLFTHMFLHGHIPHLLVNMYGLYSVGSWIEASVGTKKFLWVYFVAGTAAGLCSLYFSLFTIGVGASGAIFGIFGFALIVSIFLSRREGKSLTPILTNFAIFLGINLLLAKAVNADNAAHFGGLAAGIMIGLYSMITGFPFIRVRVEYLMLSVLIVIYFLLPRFQVSYYKFFQKILDTEASTQEHFSKHLTDEGYVALFRSNIHAWDSALTMLNAHKYLPPELAPDTFRLRRYIALRKQENIFRLTILERESYIYLDSIAWVQDTIQSFMSLDYKLSFRPGPSRSAPVVEKKQGDLTKVYYDSNWVEIPAPPAAFYRLGFRDSLGLWNGRVEDYYISGDVQMKGVYKNGKRDGVFIYYSDHKTYTSAGRYQDDQSIGKWETYHHNGKLESEVYYSDGYYVKNLWDSAGVQQVKDGKGRELKKYPNGVVSTEGEYVDGRKHGYWYGRHADGRMYFEETYDHGRLLRGRSRNLNGDVFLYDESSFFPLPEGGYKRFYEFVRAETDKVKAERGGTVRLSFRVTTNRVITDISIEKGLTPELDQKAREILVKGPGWIPARVHGQQSVDGFALINVEFH